MQKQTISSFLKTIINSYAKKYNLPMLFTFRRARTGSKGRVVIIGIFALQLSCFIYQF